jgi:hypothetical protein
MLGQKEEREFLEAWQREREATERSEELERALKMAQKDKDRLEQEKQRHDQAQTELDAMYNHIFSGPTPDLPGEDQMEDSVNACREWFQQCQMRLGSEKQALDSLAAANHSMARAQNDMREALQYSTYDMFGGGTFTDMMERDSLSRAQNNITQVSWKMSEASRAQPAIRPLSQVNIDQGHFISDVLFDNIFTDMAQHDRIKGSAAQVEQAAALLKQQIVEQQQRFRDASAQLKQASQNLEDARKELQRIRAEAFERLSGDVAMSQSGYMHGGVEAPPAYSTT